MASLDKKAKRKLLHHNTTQMTKTGLLPTCILSLLSLQTVNAQQNDISRLYDTIDSLIEKTEDYEKRIKQDYGIS